MKNVMITWRDSNRYLEQIEQDHDFQTVLINTVGHLVSADKFKVVVAQDEIDGELRGVIAIPTENIIKMWEMTDMKLLKVERHTK